jgi:hypothetical protein
MSQKGLIIIIGFCVGLFTSCIHYSVRSPENYLNLVNCKQDADQNRNDHIERVLNCLPLADEFVKSQEIYKLDQDELLEAFNALYGVYFYEKNRGGADLQEIFNRFEEKNRTRDMASNVLKKYITARDFVHAKEFIEAHPEYKLESPPEVTGTANPKMPQILKMRDVKTLLIENFKLPNSAIVYVVFHPTSPASLEFHKYLTSNQLFTQNILKHIVYLYPQDGNINPSILRWALAHPLPTSNIVYKEESFTDLLPHWETSPIIYFFNKKELQSTLSGWNKESSSHFREGLKRIHLL